MARIPGCFSAMAFIGSAIVQPAIADAELRCQGALVRLGMTRAEVVGLCGEPATQDVEDHDVLSGTQVVGRTSVWVWTYEVNGATHVLVFEQDKLKSIQ